MLVLVYGFAVAVPVASSLLVVFVCFGVDVEPSFDSSSTVKSTMSWVLNKTSNNNVAAVELRTASIKTPMGSCHFSGMPAASNQIFSEPPPVGATANLKCAIAFSATTPRYDILDAMM